MQLYVVMPDGQRYGPVTAEVLRNWAAERRVLPDTWIENAQTGERVLARQIPGLMAAGGETLFALEANPLRVLDGGPAQVEQETLTAFSYGAMGLPFFWGIAHRNWKPLMCVPIGFLGSVLTFFHPLGAILQAVLVWTFCIAWGRRGMRWAWQSGRFASQAQLEATQRKWNNWGIVGITIQLCFTLLSLLPAVSWFFNP